jgi:hypothetical protein
VQQRVADDGLGRLREARIAQCITLAALPAQVEIGGVFRAR